MPLLVFGGLLLIALITVAPYLIVGTIQAIVSMVSTLLWTSAFLWFLALLFLFATIALVVS